MLVAVCGLSSLTSSSSVFRQLVSMRGSASLALIVACLATFASSIIYDYNGIALPPSSVLVSTHGLYGASGGVAAFVKVSLAFSQGYNAAGRSTQDEKLQLIFLKVPGKDEHTYYGPTTMRCTEEGPDGGLVDASQLGKIDNVVNVTVVNGVGKVDAMFPVSKGAPPVQSPGVSASMVSTLFVHALRDCSPPHKTRTHTRARGGVHDARARTPPSPRCACPPAGRRAPRRGLPLHY
jgi:hypothetical protein